MQSSRILFAINKNQQRISRNAARALDSRPRVQGRRVPYRVVSPPGGGNSEMVQQPSSSMGGRIYIAAPPPGQQQQQQQQQQRRRGGSRKSSSGSSSFRNHQPQHQLASSSGLDIASSSPLLQRLAASGSHRTKQFEAMLDAKAAAVSPSAVHANRRGAAAASMADRFGHQIGGVGTKASAFERKIEAKHRQRMRKINREERRSRATSSLLHPCVAQLGACPDPVACPFRSVPADLCLNTLRFGRCPGAEDGSCRFKHSSSSSSLFSSPSVAASSSSGGKQKQEQVAVCHSAGGGVLASVLRVAVARNTRQFKLADVARALLSTSSSMSHRDQQERDGVVAETPIADSERELSASFAQRLQEEAETMLLPADAIALETDRILACIQFHRLCFFVPAGNDDGGDGDGGAMANATAAVAAVDKTLWDALMTEGPSSSQALLRSSSSSDAVVYQILFRRLSVMRSRWAAQKQVELLLWWSDASAKASSLSAVSSSSGNNRNEEEVTMLRCVVPWFEGTGDSNNLDINDTSTKTGVVGSHRHHRHGRHNPYRKKTGSTFVRDLTKEMRSVALRLVFDATAAVSLHNASTPSPTGKNLSSSQLLMPLDIRRLFDAAEFCSHVMDACFVQRLGRPAPERSLLHWRVCFANFVGVCLVQDPSNLLARRSVVVDSVIDSAEWERPLVTPAHHHLQHQHQHQHHHIDDGISNKSSVGWWWQAFIRSCFCQLLLAAAVSAPSSSPSSTESSTAATKNYSNKNRSAVSEACLDTVMSHIASLKLPTASHHHTSVDERLRGDDDIRNDDDVDRTSSDTSSNVMCSTLAATALLRRPWNHRLIKLAFSVVTKRHGLVERASGSVAAALCLLSATGFHENFVQTALLNLIAGRTTHAKQDSAYDDPYFLTSSSSSSPSSSRVAMRNGETVSTIVVPSPFVLSLLSKENAFKLALTLRDAMIAAAAQETAQSKHHSDVDGRRGGGGGSSMVVAPQVMKAWLLSAVKRGTSAAAAAGKSSWWCWCRPKWSALPSDDLRRETVLCLLGQEQSALLPPHVAVAVGLFHAAHRVKQQDHQQRTTSPCSNSYRDAIVRSMVELVRAALLRLGGSPAADEDEEASAAAAAANICSDKVVSGVPLCLIVAAVSERQQHDLETFVTAVVSSTRIFLSSQEMKMASSSSSSSLLFSSGAGGDVDDSDVDNNAVAGCARTLLKAAAELAENHGRSGAAVAAAVFVECFRSCLSSCCSSSSSSSSRDNARAICDALLLSPQQRRRSSSDDDSPSRSTPLLLATALEVLLQSKAVHLLVSHLRASQELAVWLLCAAASSATTSTPTTAQENKKLKKGASSSGDSSTLQRIDEIIVSAMQPALMCRQLMNVPLVVASAESSRNDNERSMMMMMSTAEILQALKSLHRHDDKLQSSSTGINHSGVRGALVAATMGMF